MEMIIKGTSANSALSRQTTVSTYEIGSAKYLPLQYRIELPNNTTVQLRPKSHEVLLHLCKHSGHVVEKEALVRAVWKDSCVTDDSLVQCIVDIRKSLGRDNSGILRTISRRGYMITAEHIHVESGTEDETPTVVVGPFQCDDNDKQIAGGLSEGVIVLLLKNDAIILTVDGSTAGQNATYLVTGKVQFQGGRTRVSVQLLNSLNGQYIWANIYEKNADDQFLLQDNLSRDIAADLISQITSHRANTVGFCV